MFRSKSLWDTAAIVSWSSDDVDFDDFLTWNPYLGMEVGMTRQIRDLAKAPEGQPTKNMLEPATERMSIDQMIVGYTINGAIQLGIDATKGSIEVGKDADFLAFGHDLMAEGHEGFSQNMPRDVYFSGVRMN